MKTFLLMRHGETDALGSYLAGSIPGCHLNEKGQQQAKSLAQRLSHYPIRAVYTSPLERTFETAKWIAEPHHLDPIAMTELGELKLGDWEGRTFSELEQIPQWRAFNTARSMVRPPGGELMIEAQTRMVKTMERLNQQQHDEDLVAVVSHADPLRALLAYYLGIPLDHMQRFQIDPASVSTIRCYEYSVAVLGMNYTGELPL